MKFLVKKHIWLGTERVECFLAICGVKGRVVEIHTLGCTFMFILELYLFWCRQFTNFCWNWAKAATYIQTSIIIIIFNLLWTLVGYLFLWITYESKGSCLHFGLRNKVPPVIFLYGILIAVNSSSRFTYSWFHYVWVHGIVISFVRRSRVLVKYSAKTVKWLYYINKNN